MFFTICQTDVLPQSGNCKQRHTFNVNIFPTDCETVGYFTIHGCRSVSCYVVYCIVDSSLWSMTFYHSLKTVTGFTFESTTCLRQMLQYLWQAIHLHTSPTLSATCRQYVHDKFPETERRPFRMCLRQCLQLIFSANKNFFELKKIFIEFLRDLNKNFIERCQDCAKWTAAIKFRSNLKKRKLT